MVLVAFAIDPFSLRQGLLLLLSLPHLEHLFKKQGLQPRQTRLSTRAEATVACGGFFSFRQARHARPWPRRPPPCVPTTSPAARASSIQITNAQANICTKHMDVT